MKRLSIITAVLIIYGATFSSQAYANDAKDDITGHYFEAEIRILDKLGIIKGNGLGSYYPNKNVTRAQFATFINRALKLPNANVEPFLDTKGHIHQTEIGNAVAAGILGGVGNGRFSPDRTVTREEVALILSRILVSNGFTAEPKPLPFKDIEKFKYPNQVQPVITYKIMAGYMDQTFRPQESVTRAQTAAVIYKIYKLLEQTEKEKLDQDIIEESDRDPDPKSDDSDADADQIDLDTKEDSNREDDDSSSKGSAGNKGNQNSIVIAKKLLNVYEDGVKRVRTYVNTGTEMKFLEEESDEIKVEVAGVAGFVKKEEVDLIPEDVAVRSYYKNANGDLRHYIARNGQYESYIFGQTPSFFNKDDKEYSFDGKTFAKGTFYQYFNYLPLLTETSYSGDQLDEFVESQYPASPLIGLGEAFKEAENETGVNALYLLAHAIHESAWGFSQIAQDKFNLYGIRAIDADAYNSAMEFSSFEDCIMYAATYVKDKYLIPGNGSYNSGPFLGNKGAGMNLLYASDPYWGQKIAGHMYRADRYLGQEDLDQYDLVISTVSSLNVRSGPSTRDEILYENKYAGITMIVLDKVKKSDGTWYKIKSAHPDYDEGYIYANGEKGKFAEIIN